MDAINRIVTIMSGTINSILQLYNLILVDVINRIRGSYKNVVHVIAGLYSQ